MCQQIAFRLGLSYLPLAITGIDALEQWSRELEPSVIIPHYKHVLPYLNDYLKSSGTEGKPQYTSCEALTLTSGGWRLFEQHYSML